MLASHLGNNAFEISKGPPDDDSEAHVPLQSKDTKVMRLNPLFIGRSTMIHLTQTVLLCNYARIFEPPHSLVHLPELDSLMSSCKASFSQRIEESDHQTHRRRSL